MVGDLQCPRCRETRLITPTVTAGRTDYYCDVCSYIWREMVTSKWDAMNAAAELMRCEICGIEYYMTHPQALCTDCRGKTAQAVSGWLVNSAP